METINPPRSTEDEFATPVMVYLNNGIGWGDLIIKKPFRPTTWLRANTLSDTIHLHDAKFVRLLMEENPKPNHSNQLIIPFDQILGFHVLPPAKEPLDYDPNEPNLRFDPVQVVMGMFQVNGKIRLPINASMEKYLRDTREQYTTIYNANVICPYLSKTGEIHVPFILVRKQSTIFIEIQKP